MCTGIRKYIAQRNLKEIASDCELWRTSQFIREKNPSPAEFKKYCKLHNNPNEKFNTQSFAFITALDIGKIDLANYIIESLGEGLVKEIPNILEVVIWISSENISKKHANPSADIFNTDLLKFCFYKYDQNYVAIVIRLIALGADLNKTTEGNTPLWFVLEKTTNIALAVLLISKGAYITSDYFPLKKGKTMLRVTEQVRQVLAAKHRQIDILLNRLHSDRKSFFCQIPFDLINLIHQYFIPFDSFTDEDCDLSRFILATNLVQKSLGKGTFGKKHYKFSYITQYGFSRDCIRYFQEIIKKIDQKYRTNPPFGYEEIFGKTKEASFGDQSVVTLQGFVDLINKAEKRLVPNRYRDWFQIVISPWKNLFIQRTWREQPSINTFMALIAIGMVRQLWLEGRYGFRALIIKK
ncbi:MAG TPA: hypothetical protein VHA52_00270 [Candidatus Babeliaceae bacterium]|nr:hypothetical protein [Candidatus Babeliaceae bacterium]